MSARRNGQAAATVRAMTEYTLEAKNAPIAPAAGAAPDSAPEAAPSIEDVEQHEWAGDLFEGEPTDPAQAFGRLTGKAGEEAWLDRDDDGTITAWVRDTDGSVYRYSDADAWAIDVDHAQMTRSDAGPIDGGGEAAAADDAAAAEEAATVDEPAEADPAAALDSDGGALEGLPDEGEVIPDDADEIDDVDTAPEDTEDPETDPDGDEPEDAEDTEDEDDEFPFERKSWPAPDGGRFYLTRS